MGVSKTQQYHQQTLEMASIFKALGHPARVAIVEHLIKVKQCICNDLVDELSLAQPTTVQHLKELKNAGIIQGSVEGNTVCYCLNPKTFERIKYNIDFILKTLSSSKKCC